MQKDYELNEKIVSAKVDSFEWLQNKLDYEYKKVEDSNIALNNAIVYLVTFKFDGVDDYWIAALIEIEEYFYFCSGYIVVRDAVNPTPNWDSVPIIGPGGSFAEWYNQGTSVRGVPVVYVDAINDPKFADLGQYEVLPYFAQVNRRVLMGNILAVPIYYSISQILDYLRDFWYDQRDPNLKPLPQYYSETVLVSVDEYGDKVIKDAEILADSGWWQGEFPLTPNFHMVFWDGNSYFLPDGTQMAELTQRYAKNSLDFADQYLIVRPTSRILSRYLYFILPRKGVSAYGRAGDWEEPNLQEVIQIRKLFQKMEFQVNLWQYGTPRFIILEILRYLRVDNPRDVTNKPYLLYLSSPEDWYAIVDRFNSLNQLDVISSLLTKIGGAL